MADDTIDGASIISEAFKSQGIKYMFGIVGIPIVEISLAAQNSGIHYIGMRNEQAASYATSAIGYLTQKPAVCLVVPGPGLIHALAGMVNAHVNCWPMIVIAGSYDQDQGGMGAFQEYPQLDYCRYCCKYATRIETLESIPFHIEKAVRASTYGRPGPCYLEIPGNLVTESINVNKIRYCSPCPEPPLTFADPVSITAAVKCLRNAIKPLVIIGKGAAYSRAGHELSKLVSINNFPFLPTPMGKGVLPDDHPFCVAAARSKVLREADVILMVGARLNWILHFGRPPRFNPNVKLIQVDIFPEEMSNSVSSHVMLCGNAKAVVGQLNVEFSKPCSYAPGRLNSWWSDIQPVIERNIKSNIQLANDKSLPMTFYCAYNEIVKFIPRDAIIVNEGSSTMDIGRTVLKTFYPLHRLDAGTFGTMGVGCGFAIAAALSNSEDGEMPQRREKRSPIFCIQGDSAFGFSGMELETACRYKLPIVFIIMNNSGIYRGVDKESWNSINECDTNELGLRLPPTSLLNDTKYNKMAECFGAKGYNVVTPEELRRVLSIIMKDTSIALPAVVNIVISGSSERKPQEFSWLTRSNL